MTVIFDEYVPANEIWPNAKTHIDRGHIIGYVRGYNVEVKQKDGTTTWLSAEWIHEEPIDEFNDEFHRWYYREHGWKPTGRIAFRGYGIEKYDPQERDFYIVHVEEE